MIKSQVNTKNNNQKKQLSKEDINSIKRRMSQLRKENTDRKTSTQALIPYKTMFPDGTCHIGGKKYSQTVEFYDTDYQLATYDEKGSKFSSWCDILNYFDDSIQFQNTYENQIMDKDSMIKYVKINDVNDSYNDIRKEYSNIRIENLFGGNNGRSIKKYLTFTTEAKNLREARAKLNTVANEVIQLFADMKVSARKLSGEKRLESMYKSLNPFTTIVGIIVLGGIAFAIYKLKKGKSTKKNADNSDDDFDDFDYEEINEDNNADNAEDNK